MCSKQAGNSACDERLKMGGPASCFRGEVWVWRKMWRIILLDWSSWPCCNRLSATNSQHWNTSWIENNKYLIYSILLHSVAPPILMCRRMLELNPELWQINKTFKLIKKPTPRGVRAECDALATNIDDMVRISRRKAWNRYIIKSVNFKNSYVSFMLWRAWTQPGLADRRSNWLS